ncbi:hypothetical protein ATK17_3598 [Branchiibius hedensis]|uniref:Uncharacterized protein n=1 Tax=Branchiibius hedensis TaxID=672460 RepID=A0A2Y9C2J9_9MICO|nr:hypothetical protein ATK17_3598 [Branchiibius hedensis]SSA36213.1 hypothetical protein SAMN04489750_3598 [Branchiibius hedensis]
MPPADMVLLTEYPRLVIHAKHPRGLCEPSHKIGRVKQKTKTKFR